MIKKINILLLVFTMMFSLTITKTVKAEEKTEVPVSFKKINKEGDLLAGATLKVVKVDDDSVVEEWNTSDKNPNVLLLDEGDYKLVEVTAPEKYVKAEDVAFTVKKDLVEEENDQKYYIAWTSPKTYNNGENNAIRNPIYVSEKAKDSNDVLEISENVAYCFNKNKQEPREKTSIFYDSYVFKKLNYTPELFLKIASEVDPGDQNTGNSPVPTVSAQVLNDAVLSIIHNGFPNDASGLMAKYNLTEGQFRNVTQDAIWKFTDNSTVNNGFTDDMKAAFAELVDYENNAKPITGMKLDIYRPYNEDQMATTYQNILSAHFTPMKTIEITMINVFNENNVDENDNNVNDDNNNDNNTNKNNNNEVEKEKTENKTEETLPKTGESKSIVFYSISALLLVLGVYYIIIKSKKVSK